MGSRSVGLSLTLCFSRTALIVLVLFAGAVLVVGHLRGISRTAFVTQSFNAGCRDGQVDGSTLSRALVTVFSTKVSLLAAMKISNAVLLNKSRNAK